MNRCTYFCALLLQCIVVPIGATESDEVGSQDAIRVTNLDHSGRSGEHSLIINVVNDEPIIGMDIPLRFGQPGDPVTLLRVEFTDRVADWDFKHASIDNENKTVILGLISVMDSVREEPGLLASTVEGGAVAKLVFAPTSEVEISIDTFTTREPAHEIMLYYNTFEDGRPRLRSISPPLELDLNYMSGLGVEGVSLSQGAPNPFNASTSLSLSLSARSTYDVQIVNTVGQVVRRVSGSLEAGTHRISWDGRNDAGAEVASGVYFLRISTNTFKATRRLTLLK